MDYFITRLAGKIGLQSVCELSKNRVKIKFLFSESIKYSENVNIILKIRFSISSTGIATRTISKL